MLSLDIKRTQSGHLHRLGRVTAAVPISYYLVAQTVGRRVPHRIAAAQLSKACFAAEQPRAGTHCGPGRPTDWLRLRLRRDVAHAALQGVEPVTAVLRVSEAGLMGRCMKTFKSRMGRGDTDVGAWQDRSRVGGRPRLRTGATGCVGALLGVYCCYGGAIPSQPPRAQWF